MSEQPMPVPGCDFVPPVARDLFTAMLDQRVEKGMATYGSVLMTHNGRDVFRDLLEELVDAWQYAVQARMEAADQERERQSLEAVARAAITEADTYRVPGACPCPVCEAVRGLPAKLRERLMKEAGE